MKICIICLTNKGGMVHYASQLSNSLSKNNYVSFITSEGFKDYHYFDSKINIHKLPIPPKKLLSLSWLRFDILSETLDKIDPDIIHITIAHPLLFPLLISGNRPIVLTVHDIAKHPGDKDFLGTFKIASKLFIKKSRRIFVHGIHLKDALIQSGIDPKKIIVINHGDYSFFAKLIRDSNHECDTLLFFGRIREYKGLNYLLDAFEEVSRCFPSIKLVIAGEGAISDLNIKNKNVILINRYIPDKEVADIFVKSKIVILPYIEGSQSGIIPIAYAFKKPVVATSVGSIKEAVIDGVTGYLVPPKDSGSLAKAIIMLLGDDDLRTKMGKQGFIWMEKELSWSKVAEKTIIEYQQVILNI